MQSDVSLVQSEWMAEGIKGHKGQTTKKYKPPRALLARSIYVGKTKLTDGGGSFSRDLELRGCVATVAG